jgi:phosphoglycolate phosphatase
MDYVPVIKETKTGLTRQITEFAGTCVPTGKVQIYAKPLEQTTKIFTRWDEDDYMIGQPGDYLAVRTEDKHDIYIVEKNIFGVTYSEV